MLVHGVIVLCPTLGRNIVPDAVMIVFPSPNPDFQGKELSNAELLYTH